MNRQLTDMEALFRALADTTRLRILGLLQTGEVCVCHIHESLKIPQPKASRHLACLRRKTSWASRAVRRQRRWRRVRKDRPYVGQDEQKREHSDRSRAAR